MNGIIIIKTVYQKAMLWKSMQRKNLLVCVQAGFSANRTFVFSTGKIPNARVNGDIP